MKAACAAVGLCVGLIPEVALAAGVVVFPLDPRNTADTVADQATQSVLRSVDRAKGLRLISPKQVKADLGVGPAERARECDYDVFCLVELGELVGADRLLTGHVRQPNGKSEVYELKLVAVDVVKATITDLVRWTVVPKPSSALDDAAAAAARRLLTEPDAAWPILLEPADAQLEIYGERMDPEELNGRFWSGTYRVVVVAPGHEPDAQVIRLQSGQNRALEVALLVDPNYRPSNTKNGQPFDRSSRRLGSGIGADTVGAKGQLAAQGPPAYTTPWPWAAAGAGLVVTVAGGALMAVGQSKYNTFAQQPRYASGTGAGQGVSAAREARDAAQGQHRIGSGLAIVGVGVLVGAGLWMLIDAAMGDSE